MQRVFGCSFPSFVACYFFTLRFLQMVLIEEVVKLPFCVTGCGQEFLNFVTLWRIENDSINNRSFWVFAVMIFSHNNVWQMSLIAAPLQLREHHDIETILFTIEPSVSQNVIEHKFCSSKTTEKVGDVGLIGLLLLPFLSLIVIVDFIIILWSSGSWRRSYGQRWQFASPLKLRLLWKRGGAKRDQKGKDGRWIDNNPFKRWRGDCKCQSSWRYCSV